VTARAPTLAAIRRSCGDDDPDGQVRLLFLRDRGRIGLVQTAQETADNADQFLTRYLAGMITDVAAPAVLVTVRRSDGRPTTSDRQLWNMLVEHLGSNPSELVDLVTLSPDRAWSVRRGAPLKAPRRRRAGSKSASPAAAR
jgi:hypothetical protein